MRFTRCLEWCIGGSTLLMLTLAGCGAPEVSSTSQPEQTGAPDHSDNKHASDVRTAYQRQAAMHGQPDNSAAFAGVMDKAAKQITAPETLEQVMIGGVNWYVDYDAASKLALKLRKPMWLHFGENPG